MQTANTPEVAAKNNAKRRQVREQIAANGYASVYLGGEKVHAAKSMMRGWGGHVHPRALCQRATTTSYASVIPAQEITCKRCLASLES